MSEEQITVAAPIESPPVDNVPGPAGPDAEAPEVPQNIAPVAPATESVKATDAAELIMLEGMKVVFDEKVGLVPVQVVKRTDDETLQ